MITLVCAEHNVIASATAKVDGKQNWSKHFMRPRDQLGCKLDAKGSSCCVSPITLSHSWAWNDGHRAPTMKTT
jgi:hypothetical protein